MENTPNKYVCQPQYMDKLTPGLIHRTINKLVDTEDELTERLHPLKIITCSEPFIWSPWIDETGRNAAYGREALPRLRKEMSYNDENTACIALNSLSEILHDPEIAVEAIRLNIVPRFVKTLQSRRDQTVERSLLCLKSISNQPTGMSAIINNEHIIEKIRNCIAHPKSFISYQAAITINALVQNYFAVATLVEARYVKEILKFIIPLKNYLLQSFSPDDLGRLTEAERKEYEHLSIIDELCPAEIKDIMLLHLDTLDRLLDYGEKAIVEAIASDALTLSPFLTVECKRLLKSAAILFGQLAKHSIGKNAVVIHGLIPDLCNGVAYGESEEIKTKMAGALQFATIHRDGRKQALNCNIIDILFRLLKYNVSEEFRRYAIQILTNLAELPQGREILKSMLNTNIIESLLKYAETDRNIALHVQELIYVINWVP